MSTMTRDGLPPLTLPRSEGEGEGVRRHLACRPLDNSTLQTPHMTESIVLAILRIDITLYCLDKISGL